MSDLTLSTSGIAVAKRILHACKAQRDDFVELEKLVYRRYPHKIPELLGHDFGVRYVNMVEKLWRGEGRQVLSIHPDLLNEVKVATSAEISPEVYRTIPFLNPMVVFADPPTISSWGNPDETMKVLGFFIHGRSQKARFIGHELSGALNNGEVILSSHDPDMERLGFVIVTEVFDANGDTKTFEYNRTAIDLSRAQSIDFIAKELVETYNWTELDDGTAVSKAAREEFMRTIYSLVLGSVLYLCSTVLDTEEVPKSRVRRSMGKERKPFAVTNIGWKIGPALSRLRRQGESGGKSTPTGRRLPPHMRKCHFKVVWTGQGRKIPKTVFIAPYWVNKDLLEEGGAPTVRAVR